MEKWGKGEDELAGGGKEKGGREGGRDDTQLRWILTNLLCLSVLRTVALSVLASCEPTRNFLAFDIACTRFSDAATKFLENLGDLELVRASCNTKTNHILSRHSLPLLETSLKHRLPIHLQTLALSERR